MGVLRLFKHLINTYKDFYFAFPSNPKPYFVDVLCIDLNALFHPACREIYYPEFVNLLHTSKPTSAAEQELLAFQNVVKYIENIISVTPPKKVLYLAIDGVAGMCKQSQQRKRRYKAAKEAAANPSKVEDKFNMANITAGTPFMSRLCKYLSEWIKWRKYSSDYNIDLHRVQIIYNDMYVAGEGEHKLIRYLSQSCSASTSYCVYSPDADLIMLCMCLSKGRGYILRENIYDELKAKWILVDCNKLKANINTTIQWNSMQHTYTIDRAVRDYVLFLMLVGNDFLPNLYCLEIGNQGIETLQQCYISAATSEGYLVNDVNVIERKPFVELFKQLADHEAKLILQKYFMRVKYPDNLLAAHIVHTQLETGQTIQQLDFKALRTAYYTQKFKHDFEWSEATFEANIQAIVKAFVRGLNFVMTYYAQSIPSFDWCYEYHYAPLMIDVYECTQSWTQRNWNQLQEWNYKTPLTLNQALLGIIPPSSFKVLPEAIQPLLEKNKDHPLFSDDFEVDLEGKQQDYEGICLLPNVPYTTLKRMCKEKYELNEPMIF